MAVDFLGEILSLAQQLQTQAAGQQQQATLDTILQAINGNLALSQIILGQLVQTQAALSAQIAALSPPVNATNGTVQTWAMRGVPVGASTVTAIGGSVWDQSQGAHEIAGSFGFALGSVESWVLDRASGEVYVYVNNPLFLVWNQGSAAPLSGAIFGDVLPATLATVRATDTALTWLTREDPAHDWSDGTFAPGYVSADGNSVPSATVFLRLSDDEFIQLRDQIFATPTRVLPVWPGLANVSLGASVALADGLVIAGPLDGVLVEIASVPYPIGYYAFGSEKSFVHVGGIVFQDDNGQYEQAIPLGLADHVIVPKVIEHPVSATIRIKSGVTGTIQPWTVA